MSAGASAAPALGRIGVWSRTLRWGPRDAAASAARELESLGYGAVWMPDSGGDVVDAVENVLGATTTMTVCTGVLNVWMHDAGAIAQACARLVATYGDRLLVGLGVSHAPVIERLAGVRYSRPMAVITTYLDQLDTAAPPLPRERRVLAALGPRMLELAAERAAGAHPYLVTPAHTALARAALGPAAVLAPEQAVLVERDPDVARRAAREHLAPYLALPNYIRNWRRLGFGDDDLSGGGSDRLVDAMVAWGDVDAVRARVDEHLDAGADHVCLNALSTQPVAPMWTREEGHPPAGEMPIEQWRAVARLVA